MKRTIASIVCLLMLCTATSAQSRRASIRGAETVPAAKATVDEVEQLLTRNVWASGGPEIFKVMSRTTRGTITMTGTPETGTFETYAKGQHKSMMVANTPRGQIIEASDGDRRWLQTPWGARSASAIHDQELASRGAVGKDGFKWRNVFSSASLKGKRIVDGQEMLVLAGTLHGLPPMLWYFDAGTFLLRKVELARPAGAGEAENLRAVYFDSYATVDGVKVPALIRQVFTTFTLTFRVTEVKHNVYINDALFRDPDRK